MEGFQISLNPLNDLFNTKEEVDVKRKIVEELFNNNENLSAKTELDQPLKWSCLDVIKEFIEKHNLPKSTEIMNRFINTSFVNLISKSRKGREEYIKALQSLSNLTTPEQPKINPMNPLQ
jgi:hypothetical protein